MAKCMYCGSDDLTQTSEHATMEGDLLRFYSCEYCGESMFTEEDILYDDKVESDTMELSKDALRKYDKGWDSL